MDIKLVVRDGCPSAGEIARNAASALKSFGSPSEALVCEKSAAGQCPSLLINSVAVFSCFPNKKASDCPACGTVPDIPDTEIIRWHLARALGRKTVLFICSGNAVRSQMAEALVNHALGDTWAAFSAGIMPMQLWKPVVKVLQEIGIDAGWKQAKHIELFLGCRFDLIISLCSDADAFCTAFPGEGMREHMPFEDPMTSSFFGVGDTERTRTLRDNMKSRLLSYLGGSQ